MKQKYPLLYSGIIGLFLFSGSILNAQNSNPLVSSMHFKPGTPNKSIPNLLKDAVEDSTQRTPYSSTWKGKNGRIISKYSSVIVNYKDANGRLVPIDLTLHSDSKGWVADKQPNPCYFHSDRSTEINLGGNDEITFNKNCAVNGMALDQHIVSMEGGEVKLDMSEGVHKHINFVTGGVKTDYVFDHVLEGGISVTEEVEIPKGATLQKDVNNGSMLTEGWCGDYELVSASGKILAKFVAAECYDYKKQWCYAAYSVQNKDGKNILTTTIPSAWLIKAVYPVTLDPLVIGATALWGGGSSESCLYPKFHTDSILVTIPPKITISYFTVDYAYVSSTSLHYTIPTSYGIFYLSTTCGRTDTTSCADSPPSYGDTAGVCYLDPYEDFHCPMSSCYLPSCSPQSFWVYAHLSRRSGGLGCDTTTIWYTKANYKGFQYYFSAYVEGYTDSVSILKYIPSPQCSNNCTLTMDATILDGVPPYTVTHPWAAKDTVVGSYTIGNCKSEGTTQMKLTIPGVNCPFTCLSPDTIIMIPPPVVVDFCGDTVKNLKATPVKLTPVPVLSYTPVDTFVCSGSPVTLNVTSCIPGTTFSWLGSDKASGSGSNLSDPSTDTSYTLPMKVTYKIVGNYEGCNSDTLITKGVINPYPNATVRGTDTLDLGKSETLIANGGGTYSWSPVTDLSCASCPDPTASPKVTTTYTVTVTDSEGCSKVIPFTIYVLDENIVVPNVITPNGDNINDLFVISGLEYYTNSKLTIYDRWGKQVYYSSNYQNNWNGGGQSDGVYYYVLVLSNGKKFDGYLQIIK